MHSEWICCHIHCCLEDFLFISIACLFCVLSCIQSKSAGASTAAKKSFNCLSFLCLELHSGRICCCNPLPGSLLVCISCTSFLCLQLHSEQILVHHPLHGNYLACYNCWSLLSLEFQSEWISVAPITWKSSCLFPLPVLFVSWVAFRVNFSCLSTWKTLCLFQFLSFLCHSFYKNPMNNWNTETTKELQNGSKNFFRSHEFSGNYFRSNLSPDRKILNLFCKWVHQNLSKPVVTFDYLTAWWNCVCQIAEKNSKTTIWRWNYYKSERDHKNSMSFLWKTTVQKLQKPCTVFCKNTLYSCCKNSLSSYCKSCHSNVCFYHMI